MKTNTPLYSCLAALGLTCWLGTQPALAFVTVTVLPTNQVVLVGGSAVFNAQASTSAGETITGYIWQMSTNGLSPFTTIPGATSAAYTLANVQTTNAGFYFAKATYNSGTNFGLESVSAAVTLVVHDQARIISQPQGGFIRITGSNASFSVGALGAAPLSYQWRLNGANLADSTRITGSSGSNLALSALIVADSGSYDVVVTNLYAIATSQVATLSVFAPPGISLQPADLTIITGSNATFSVTPTGSAPLSFRWQKDGANLSDGGRISGATSNVLTIAAATTNDAGGYSVSITNIVGSTNSSAANLTVLVPATFTSATSATGRQGLFFSFTNSATGTLPITFGVDSLPTGLSLESTNGIISGIPAVTGLFNLTIYATNAAMTTTGQLALTFTTGAPGITSGITASGKQGNSFTYTITASNNPAVFSAAGLPPGLNLNLASGVISGVPIVSGVFTNTLGATNQYGWDSRVLTITLSSALPVITSARTATGTENVSGFSYIIRASNTNALTQYGASGLPLGLSVNTNSGAITGTPLYGGTYTVPIWAINAWGTGTTNLTLTINYATVGGLGISNVTYSYSSPYLLDFTFSLVDNSDPTTLTPVVRLPSQLQIVCMENGVPIPSETAFVVTPGSQKQLKSYLVLDYTYSMYAVSGAITAMQAAAENFINVEPASALFGVCEFNADYSPPQLVTTNGFTSIKPALTQAIEGIQTNFVQGNYAGSRCWDAIYLALQQFGTNNSDEQRYLVAMTDGNDDSSLLNTNADPVSVLVGLAQTNQVRIYVVAFGANVNTNALQELTSGTLGQYYLAATTADLTLQFENIAKNLNGQYILRWATLQRAATNFTPSFQVTVDGFSDTWTGDTNSLYNPPDFAGNVKVGGLRLVPDADVGPQTIRLRATYVPRYVREIQMQYRPNYPCTSSLASADTNEILYGWSLTETNDATGLRTLTLLSPNPSNLLSSITYGAFGDLVAFQFTYPEAVTTTQAFSVFNIDNTVYTNMLPNGQSFVLSNASSFITLYTNPPPHGTPIPWLRYYGFKTNYAAAELIATNGLPVWQDYVAGLNPTNPSSRFLLWTAFPTNKTPPQVMFTTVPTRSYRLEAATPLGNWLLLRDNMPGTGGNILFIDNRVLTGVNAVFYRVGVH